MPLKIWRKSNDPLPPAHAPQESDPAPLPVKRGNTPSPSRSQPRPLTSKVPGSLKITLPSSLSARNRPAQPPAHLELAEASRIVADLASPTEALWQVRDGLEKLRVGHEQGSLALPVVDRLDAIEVLGKLQDRLARPRLEVQWKKPFLQNRQMPSALTSTAQGLVNSIIADDDGLTVPMVKNLAQLGERHGFLNAKSKAQVDALRKNPNIPVDDGAEKGLLSLPAEIVRMIGDNLLHSQRRGSVAQHPDLEAFTLARLKLHRQMPDHVSIVRRDGFIDEASKSIKTLDDYRSCLSLIEKTLSNKGVSNGYPVVQDTLRPGTDVESDQSRALKRLIERVTWLDAALWEPAFDQACVLMKKLRRDQRVGIMRSMLIVARQAPDDLARKILAFCENQSAATTALLQVALLSDIKETKDDFRQGATGDEGSFRQRATALYQQLRVECEDKTADSAQAGTASSRASKDFRPELWGMINVGALLRANDRLTAAETCQNFISKLHESQKAPFLAALFRFAVASLANNDRTEVARHCLKEGVALSSTVIDSDFAQEMSTLYQSCSKDLAVTDFCTMLDIFDKTDAGKRGGEMPGLFDLAPGQRLAGNDLTTALDRLRDSLGRCRPPFVASQLRALTRSTRSLQGELFLEHQKADISLIRSLPPEVAGNGTATQWGPNWETAKALVRVIVIETIREIIDRMTYTPNEMSNAAAFGLIADLEAATVCFLDASSFGRIMESEAW